MNGIDETHDASVTSWVESARGHEVFPVQNLPFGVFSPRGGNARGGVAIGDEILDLKAAVEAHLFSGGAEHAARLAAQPTLNAFMALGSGPRAALRKQLFALLSDGTAESATARMRAAALLHKSGDCSMHVPARIGAYTDFYAGIHHAWNGGVRHKRPAPLLPNYKWVPVAYHSRASSVIVSGTSVQRPNGQRKLPDQEAPTFGPCGKLDFELELGVWVSRGNGLGDPIPIATAHDHLAGLCMLNDWSARDIQTWEAQPLGPFLAKNFATTISPWIVSMEALAPFRRPQPPRPADDPKPLAYLWDDADQGSGAFEVQIEALIRTAAMRRNGTVAHRLSSSNLHHLYWTVAQMVSHHTCNGCNLQPGDLFGSGTISAPERSGFGSLAELSDDGNTVLHLPSGETRTFLQDGDEIILRARAVRDGYATIGFGDCAGVIVPAPACGTG